MFLGIVILVYFTLFCTWLIYYYRIYLFFKSSTQSKIVEVSEASAEEENFPFIDLPYVVQKLIVEKFIQDFEFTDRKQLLLTSKFCNWLVQNSKKKSGSIFDFEIDDFDKDFVHFLIYSSSSGRSFDATFDKFVNFLKIVEIEKFLYSNDFLTDSKFGFFSNLKNLWLNALKNLKTFEFPFYPELLEKENVREFFSYFIKIKTSTIYNHGTSDDLLKIVPMIPNLQMLICHENMDHRILELLSSKSSDTNPLIGAEFHEYDGFFIDNVEKFLKVSIKHC